MLARSCSFAAVVRPAALLLCLAFARPALAQDAVALQNLREQYDAMMSNFEHILKAQSDPAGTEKARRGREAMRGLSDQQLANLYSHTRIPNLSVVVTATQYLVSQADSPKTAHAGALKFATAGPTGPVGIESLPFPEPIALDPGCNGVDISSGTRYTQLIAKEVTNSILAAAAWVCNEDILGENGSAVCIPFAIAADVANGFFDTSAWCSGEVTANQVDANFNRLGHIHDDLAAGITTIVDTSNANTTTIVNNDNANATTIVNNDNANTTTIVNNDNTNKTQIINNDNANLATIIANANANKNELRDLMLRTQIEADLATEASAVTVALYALPAAQGGYLDLVKTIVTETLARVLAAGGSISNAQAFLNDANAAKAAGDFKAAYSLYRKAYKAAGK
jgi:hypothetical protein